MSDGERQRVESMAERSQFAAGVNADTIRYAWKVFSRHLRPGSILELGPAEGIMTALLAQTGRQITAVEGSARFYADLTLRFSKVRFHHALFEQFDTEERFANIILGHVLEHVADPTAILEQCGRWLAPSGRIFANVPNSRSLHRQAAVLLGLLPFEEALNDTDVQHGHRRVFNPETFRQAFNQAGLRIELFGGFWLKPLSNAQVEAAWPPQMIDAFLELGERYPDVAGEIYIVACRGEAAAAGETS